MEILALILILVQVITKLNRNLLLFWQDPLDNGRGFFAVSYFLPYLFTLFYLWFVQVKALNYWGLVYGVVTLGVISAL